MLVLGCAEAIQAQELTEATEQTETIVPAETQSSIVVKKGNTFYCGDQQMNRAAYKQFLQNECPQAYQQYKQGQQCMIAGWALFGGGLVCAPFCGTGLFVSAFGSSATPPNQDNSARHANKAFFWRLMCVGSGSHRVCSAAVGRVCEDGQPQRKDLQRAMCEAEC